MVNALVHAAVRLSMLAKTDARKPDGLKKMFLMDVCSFLGYIFTYFNLI